MKQEEGWDKTVSCQSHKIVKTARNMNDILYQTSLIWKRIERQTNDSITEIVMFYAYKVRRADRPDDYSPVLTVGDWGKLSELGKIVENAIKDAKLTYCQINNYSINNYKVGLERSCNRLSVVIYGHWNEPCSLEEAKRKTRMDVVNNLEKPINKILESKDAYVSSSSYNDGECITKWEELDQLLCGGVGRFMEGHFCRPIINRQ